MWLKKRKQRWRVKLAMEKIIDTLKKWRKIKESIQRRSELGKLEGKFIKFRVKENAWLKSNGSLWSPRTHIFNTQVSSFCCDLSYTWQRYRKSKDSSGVKSGRSQSRGSPHNLLLTATLCNTMASGESERVSICEKRQQLRQSSRASMSGFHLDICIWVSHLGILYSGRQTFLVGFILL